MFSELIFRIKDIWYHLMLRLSLRSCYSVLDVGCGASSPLAYVKANKVTEGIDGYPESIAHSKKNKIHNSYRIGDIRKLRRLYAPKSYDAVIALDVIEHLTRIEGFQLISDMEKIAQKKIIIMTPNGYYRQYDLDRNKLQIHKSGWSVNDFQKLHFKIFGIRGPKWLRGEHATLRYKPWIFWGLIAFITEPIFSFIPSITYQIFAIKNVEQSSSKLNFLKSLWSMTHKIYAVLGPVNAWKLVMSPPVVIILKGISSLAGSRTVPFTTRYGLTLKLHLGDIIFGGYLHLGESNPLEIYILRKILGMNDVAIDVGAHLGWYTVNMAQVVGNRGKVYSFEPNPSVAVWLEENCKRNGLTNIRIERIALADKNSTMNFFVGGSDSLGSLKLMNAKRSIAEQIHHIKVPVRTLDSYLISQNVYSLKLIKVDAEGADLEVLKGAEKSLRKYHPYLIVEVYGLTWNTDSNRDKEILSFLQKLGYRAYAFTQGRLERFNPKNGQPQIINLFFAHSEAELHKLQLI